MTLRASISCNGVEITDVTQRVKQGVPEILNMRVGLKKNYNKFGKRKNKNLNCKRYAVRFFSTRNLYFFS